MSFHTLVIFVLGCLLQILLETTFVDGAVIPQPAGITATNATLGANPTYCNDLEGFVGDGIVQSDCTAAINEFYRTVVQPRGDRKYEFLMEGTDRTSEVPYIVTPNKYTYGRSSVLSHGFGQPYSNHQFRHVRHHCCHAGDFLPRGFTGRSSTAL